MSSRALNRLEAARIASITTAGRYGDGGGLYLFIDDTRRSWVFRYSWRGKKREMGLGSVHSVSLTMAREKAAEYRAWIADGKNPRSERDKRTVRMTFGHYADRHIEMMAPAWKSAKHADQWRTTLSVHAASLRPLMINEIDTDDVLNVLKPLWSRIPETADRLRGRIETILDAAKANGMRTGDNPARWRGHLEWLLPRYSKASQGHHAAMAYTEIREFMAELRHQEVIAARLLEFIILTATRTSEALHADWDEFDLERKIWIIPAERMKHGREHQVPLSEAAIALLQATPDGPRAGLVFRRKNGAKPLTNMAMPVLLRGMEQSVTVHGFRSTFRDWAAETTDFPYEVCELALAHAIPGKSDAAYRHGHLFQKRRTLMEEWARYCGGDPAPDLFLATPAALLDNDRECRSDGRT